MNKGAKSFFIKQILSLVQYAIQDPKGLVAGIQPYNVKVSIILAKLKPLHAGWFVDYYKEVQPSASVVNNGFQKAKILEAVHSLISLKILF